ncbi:hypothetical protein ACFSM7_14430 [Clavibacter michiganensis subsp. tessellarius]
MRPSPLGMHAGIRPDAQRVVRRPADRGRRPGVECTGAVRAHGPAPTTH